MNPRPKPPPPGGEVTYFIDLGPQPVPPGIPRVNLIPGGTGGSAPPPPPHRRRRRRPALPGAAELARLPAAAREAFTRRCLARLPAGQPAPADAAAAAAVAILARSPDPAAVLVIRRDFDRLRRRAKAEGWTDETPVPPDTFGPL